MPSNFTPPKQPYTNMPQDIDMWDSYYNAIMGLYKSMPEFYMDASNWGDDNNDLADIGSGKIAIYAGRYRIPNKNKSGSGQHSFRIPLPEGFHEDKKNGKSDVTDPIIIVTPENRERRGGDPVAFLVQDVDGDGFTVTVRETSGNKTDTKELNLDTINWIAIGIV